MTTQLSTRPPPAAPGELTHATIMDMVRVIATSGSVQTAAAYVGIPMDRLAGWMSRGRAALPNREELRTRQLGLVKSTDSEEDVCVVLLLAVVRALAMFEATLLQSIMWAAQGDPNGEKPTPGDWKAAAWLLERRIPSRYAPQRATAKAQPTPPPAREIEAWWDREYPDLAAQMGVQDRIDEVVSAVSVENS